MVVNVFSSSFSVGIFLFLSLVIYLFARALAAEKKKPHIKKPLNAFMLYMKEMRAKVVAECTLKESAAINQILGRRVSFFSPPTTITNTNDVLFAPSWSFCLIVSIEITTIRFKTKELIVFGTKATMKRSWLISFERNVLPIFVVISNY
jgi:hypothetical protein